jgi:hypothetical protein
MGKPGVRSKELQGEELGEVDTLVMGNGCGVLIDVEVDTETGEMVYALLLERFLYCVTFSWNDVLMGVRFPRVILLKSSADFDHAFRDTFRRSP